MPAKWTKREKDNVDTLSKGVKAVRSIIQIRISKLKTSMSTITSDIFKNPDVPETRYIIHVKYVVVPEISG